MIPSKLFEHELLKVILLDMEANQRLELSKRCPTLQRLEKSVPLKIQHLKFNPTRTALNETTYNLGIYREYPPGERVPPSFQRDNDKGGVDTDLDEYGFQETFNNSTPGALNLGHRPETHIRGASTSYLKIVGQQNVNYLRAGAEAENRFHMCQQALERRLELDAAEEKGAIQVLVQQMLDTVTESAPQFHQFQLPDYKCPSVPLVYNRDHPDYDKWFREAHRVRDDLFRVPEDPIEFRRAGSMASTHSAANIRQQLEQAEAEWLPYSYRLSNQEPPYTLLIQLTIKNGRDIRQIQRVPYVLKLQQALKKLNTVLLDGRKLLVKKLIVDKRTEVLRLFEGIKFNVEHLEVAADVLYKFWPMLDPSCYPLKVLTLMGVEPIHAGMISQIKVTREAQKLVLDNGFFNHHSLIKILTNMPNQHIELLYEGYRFQDGDFMNLVVQWLLKGRPVGTKFLFGIREEATVRTVFELVEEKVGQRRVEDRRFNIPMKNGSRLTISYHPAPEMIAPVENHDNEVRRMENLMSPLTREYETRWILQMEVVQSQRQ